MSKKLPKYANRFIERKTRCMHVYMNPGFRDDLERVLDDRFPELITISSRVNAALRDWMSIRSISRVELNEEGRVQ